MFSVKLQSIIVNVPASLWQSWEHPFSSEMGKGSDCTHWRDWANNGPNERENSLINNKCHGKNRLLCEEWATQKGRTQPLAGSWEGKDAKANVWGSARFCQKDLRMDFSLLSSQCAGVGISLGYVSGNPFHVPCCCFNGLYSGRGRRVQVVLHKAMLLYFKSAHPFCKSNTSHAPQPWNVHTRPCLNNVNSVTHQAGKPSIIR